MNYSNTLKFAQKLDENDELGSYRNEFYIPKDQNGNQLIYFCGNSLGLQPKRTKKFLDQELNDWAK